MTREKFAEELELRNSTLVRLEDPSNTSKVTNVETYFKVAQNTGYTIEEILVGIYSNTSQDRKLKKINYLLNVLYKDELNYIFKNIQEFTRFIHRNDLKTLEDIKNKIK